MDVVHVICPGCGTTVEAAATGGEFECPCCLQRFVVAGQANPPTPIPAPAPDLETLLQRSTTKVVRHGLLRNIGYTLGGTFCSTVVISVGLSAGKGWVGWVFVGFGVLVALGTLFAAHNVFNRRPVLVLCDEGLIDTRETGLRRFVPWDCIRNVSTYQFALNSLTTSTNMVEVVKLEIDDGIHAPRTQNIDVDSLGRRAGAIANLIVAYANQRRGSGS